MKPLASLIMALMFCFTLTVSLCTYKLQEDYQKQALIIIRTGQDYTDKRITQLKLNTFDAITDVAQSTRLLTIIECRQQGNVCSNLKSTIQ